MIKISFSIKTMGWNILSTIIFFVFVLPTLLAGHCGKTKIYPNPQPYNSKLDTGRLVIRISNPKGLPMDATASNSMLILFDSKNLFYKQIPQFKAVTNGKDTLINVGTVPMGHYTALLIMDNAGIGNLAPFAQKGQSYQNTFDKLNTLVTNTYIASSTLNDGSLNPIVVNTSSDTGTIVIDSVISLITQVTFNLKQYGVQNTPIWQNPSNVGSLKLLCFQNGTLADSMTLSSTQIQQIKETGTFQIPVPKGINYTFMITDIMNDATVNPSFKMGGAFTADSLINSITTPSIVKLNLESQINNIRMAEMLSTPTSLAQSTATISLKNSIQSVNIQLINTTLTPDWTNTNIMPIKTDWNLYKFDKNNHLVGFINTDNSFSPFLTVKNAVVSNPSATNIFDTIKIFTSNTYSLVAIGNSGSVATQYFNTYINQLTPAFIQNNLQANQTNLHSFLGVNSGVISNGLTAKDIYQITPTLLTNLNKMRSFVSISALRDSLTNNSTFFSNVLKAGKLKGIVTSNGKGDNDIPGTVILQDPGGTPQTNNRSNAIAIQFKNFNSIPTLKVGDEITLVLQDGIWDKVSNISTLKDVTYGLEGTSSPKSVPNGIPLTIAEIINPANYAKYECMIVSIITPLEFRWFKNKSYIDFSSDSLVLRSNASSIASTIPSARTIIRLRRNATGNTGGSLALVQIPQGKVSITGFLTKTETGSAYLSIMPRSKTDIISTNLLSDRADQGVIIKWGIENLSTQPTSVSYSPNGGLNDPTPSNRKLYGNGEFSGIAREFSFLSAKNYGDNFYIKTNGGGSAEALNGPCLHIMSENPTELQMWITIDTKEMLPGESLKLALNGSRGTSAENLTSGLTFNVDYSINNGTTWKAAPNAVMDVPNTYLKMGYFTFETTFSNVVTSSRTPIIIKITYASGYNAGTWFFGLTSGNTNTNTNASRVSFQNITLSQIQD